MDRLTVTFKRKKKEIPQILAEALDKTSPFDYIQSYGTHDRHACIGKTTRGYFLRGLERNSSANNMVVMRLFDFIDWLSDKPIRYIKVYGEEWDSEFYTIEYS